MPSSAEFSSTRPQVAEAVQVRLSCKPIPLRRGIGVAPTVRKGMELSAQLHRTRPIAVVTPIGQSSYTWSDPTSDVRALYKAGTGPIASQHAGMTGLLSPSM